MNLNVPAPIALSTSDTTQVIQAFFEDDNANIIYYYTGKDCVLGLQHPDHYMRNQDKMKYARIAFYTFNEIGDDEFLIYMNETLDITLIPSTGDKTNITKATNFKVHFEGIGEGGKVIPDSIRCTVTNNNILGTEAAPEVWVTDDTYLDSESNTKHGVGLWINITDIVYVLTNVDKSLAANTVPLDVEHFPSSYTATYLDNITKDNTTNLSMLNEVLRQRLLYTSTDAFHYINDRLNKLEEKDKYEPHQFDQNTVLYNPTPELIESGKEEVLQGAKINAPSLERIIDLDPPNKSFRVKQEGIYMLQLKNGFYLVKGESRLDLKVYKNNDEIPEMRMSCYMISNPGSEEDDKKAIKNIYSSNAYVCHLVPEDQIKVTFNFMNIDGITFENETMLSVTPLQYNIV